MIKNDDGFANYNDYNPMPVEIILSVFREQEEKISRPYINLPSKYRAELDNLPDEYCISKECGYMTVVIISNENISNALAFLFGKDEIHADIQRFITENKAEAYRLTGFWD